MNNVQCKGHRQTSDVISTVTDQRSLGSWLTLGRMLRSSRRVKERTAGIPDKIITDEGTVTDIV